MNETFIECTNALMSCLSEHDLTALQAIYAPRLAEAKREVKHHHVQGEHDGLVTHQRLLGDICEALVVEQARRKRGFPMVGTESGNRNNPSG